MDLTNLLMNSSRLPKEPPWIKCLNFLGTPQPPDGLDNLNGHKKLLACLKCGPTVTISWIKSSTDKIPYLPKLASTIALSDKAILCLLTLP